MFSENVEVRPDASRGSLSEDLLTPEQVAKRLRVSPRWVRDHATRRSPGENRREPECGSDSGRCKADHRSLETEVP